jgi:shikimate kinase
MVLKHLILTGYRGCGKTTIGRLISQSLGLPFIDTDDAIESKSGLTIAEIFALRGESSFRDLESQQLIHLESLSEPTVVSLGGGAILRDENRNRIRSLGLTVWLQASPEILYERISKDTDTATRRPKLSKLGDLEEIRSILSQRMGWYQEVANLQISTESLSTKEIATHIAQWYRART